MECTSGLRQYNEKGKKKSIGDCDVGRLWLYSNEWRLISEERRKISG